MRVAVIDVPDMKNAACVTRVVAAVRAQKGVVRGDVEADLARRRVTVPYDSLKLSLKNIEFAIAKAGFAANNVPVDEAARAKLPAACR